MRKFLIILALYMFAPSIVFSNEIIEPIKNWGELQSIVKNFNADGLILTNLQAPYGAEKDQIRNLSTKTGNFQFEEIGGTWYRLFKADINNDGEDEYTLISYGGSGQWLDLENVIKKKDGKYNDIFQEIYLDLRKYFFKNPDSDPQDTAIFEMHGDLQVEKEDEKVFFTVISANGYWYELEDDLETVKKVEEHRPVFYKFRWDANGLAFVGKEQREYQKDLDRDIQVLLEADKMWLGMNGEERAEFLQSLSNKESE